MHGAFGSPIGLSNEFYGISIEFGVFLNPYTLDGYKLSKVGTFSSQPIQERPYVWVQGNGG